MKTKPPSIILKKQSIFFKEVKFNWVSLFRAIIKSGKGFLTSNPESIISALPNFLGGIKLKSTLAHESSIALFGSYATTIRTSLKEVDLDLTREDEFLSNEEKFKKQLEGQSFQIDDLTQRFLEDTEFFKTTTKSLVDFIKNEYKRDSFSSENIRAFEISMRENFDPHLRSFIALYGDSFPKFKDFYYNQILPSQESWDKPKELRAYEKLMIDQYSSKTILEGIRLNEIYVDPTCTSRIKLTNNVSELIETPSSLLKTIINFLPMERPIVIQGEPGHGKTSFARRLSNELAGNHCHGWFPILTDFKKIIPNEDLRGLDSKAQGFLNNNFIKKKRVVFILDGFDEIFGSSTPTDQYTRFLIRLYDQIDICKTVGIGGNIIITTRKKFLEAKPDCIPCDPSYHLITINNFNKLQIDQCLKKYRKARTGSDISLKILGKYGFTFENDEQFIGLPVLLTMVSEMLSGKNTRAKFNFKKKNLDKFELYSKIVEWSFDREMEKEKTGVNRLPFENQNMYSRFLEIISQILFKEKSPSVDIRTVIANWEDDNEFEKTFKVSDWNDETNIVLFFYFKSAKDSRGDIGVEFIHKSFLDFFISKNILRFLEIIVKRIRGKELNDQETVVLLMKIVSWQPIDPNSFEFLQQGLKKINATERELTQLCDHLIIIFNNMIKHHYYSNPVVRDYFKKNLHECAVHTLGNLYNIITSLQCILPKKYICKPFSSNDSNSFFNFISFLFSIGNDNFYNYNFSFKNITLENQNCASINLSHIEFSGSIFRGVDLTNSNLSDCNFSNADLKKINFQSTNLDRTNFTGAQLNNSIFEKTSASYGDFTNSCLKAARINDSSFMAAKFGNADLHKAQLKHCSLCVANFENSDLSEVSFDYSSVDRAIFRNSNLRKADLSSAHFVTQQQVDSAYVNEKTCIPSELMHPKTIIYGKNKS